MIQSEFTSEAGPKLDPFRFENIGVRTVFQMEKYSSRRRCFSFFQDWHDKLFFSLENMIK